MATPTANGVGGVSTQNRLYQRQRENYELMRDALEGQYRIKEQGTQYLLKPPALAVAGNDPQGAKYAFYKSFAEFPELVSQALFGIQGLIHHRPPVIELPRTLQYLEQQATPDGKTLDELWMDATREVFLMGRFGLLPEVYENQVYLCQYHAESIQNWHKVKTESGMSASLVVLHEPVEEVVTGDGFGVDEVDYYRVLKVEDGQYVEELWRGNDVQASTGTQPEGVDVEMLPSYPIVPSRMGRNWSFIPFVPINAINNEYDPGQIPLLAVAQKALDMYRKSATYHRTLYLKGDPPLLRTGFSPEEAESANTIGGGVTWDAANPEADAKYIEPTGEVISDQRQAIIDDLEQAQRAIGRLVDNKGGGVESGEALRERRAANSVTLVGVLQSVAEGFEKALRNTTVVMGGNPDEVVFKPNLDFMAPELTADDVVKFTTAKNQGAPISLQSLHDTFRRGGVTQIDFDEEMQLIEDEDATFNMPGGDDPADAGDIGQDEGTDPEDLPETPDAEEGDEAQ